MEDKIKYVVYKTTDKVTSSFYIGVHKQTSIKFEGYLGSGDRLKNLVEKYGPERFTFEVLETFATKKSTYKREADIVTRDFIDREDTLNIRLGGDGGWEWINGKAMFMDHVEIRVNSEGKEVYIYPCHLPKSREKAINTCIDKFGSPMGMCHTLEAKAKSDKSKIEKYGSLVGMIHTPEVREKAQKSREISMENKGLTMDHYLNTDEAVLKRRETRDKTATKKDPRLLDEIKLIDENLNLIKSDSILNICKYLFGQRSAVKFRSRLYSSIDNDKFIKINNKKFKAMKSSTTKLESIDS